MAAAAAVEAVLADIKERLTEESNRAAAGERKVEELLRAITGLDADLQALAEEADTLRQACDRLSEDLRVERDGRAQEAERARVLTEDLQSLHGEYQQAVAHGQAADAKVAELSARCESLNSEASESHTTLKALDARSDLARSCIALFNCWAACPCVTYAYEAPFLAIL